MAAEQLLEERKKISSLMVVWRDGMKCRFLPEVTDIIERGLCNPPHPSTEARDSEQACSVIAALGKETAFSEFV